MLVVVIGNPIRITVAIDIVVPVDALDIMIMNQYSVKASSNKMNPQDAQYYTVTD